MKLTGGYGAEHVFGDAGRSGSGLRGDPASHSVRSFVDGFQRQAQAAAVSKSSGKSVAGAHGVGDLDAESGMIGIAFTADQDAAACPAGNANKFESVMLEEEFSI